MCEIVTRYDMVICSPSDTEDEIRAIINAVDDFNYHEVENVIIRPVRWNTDVHLDSRVIVQDSVDRQIIDTCDFGVAVFGDRLGTPVAGYPSGTAKEIMQLYEEGKQVFVYRKKKTERVSYTEDQFEDLKQRHDLDCFLEELKKTTIFLENYENSSELRAKFKKDLELYYRKDLKKKVPDLHKALEFGIVSIGLGSAPDQLLCEQIKKAKIVKIFSTSARGLFHRHSHSFVHLLKNGGKLKVLLPNPGSDVLIDVEQIEGNHQNCPMDREIAETMDILRKVWQDAGVTGGGKIQVGCAYTLLRQTEIICIRDNGEIWTWVTMTMPPERAGARSISLEGYAASIEGKETALANLANVNFDSSWKVACDRGSIFDFETA